MLHSRTHDYGAEKTVQNDATRQQLHDIQELIRNKIAEAVVSGKPQSFVDELFLLQRQRKNLLKGIPASVRPVEILSKRITADFLSIAGKRIYVRKLIKKNGMETENLPDGGICSIKDEKSRQVVLFDGLGRIIETHYAYGKKRFIFFLTDTTKSNPANYDAKTGTYVGAPVEWIQQFRQNGSNRQVRAFTSMGTLNSDWAPG
jgi:hypothetical protein